MTGTQRGFYRSRSGIILGVCKGLGQYLDVSVTGIRVAWVVLTFIFVGTPILAYILAALIMKPEPGTQSEY